MVDTLQKMGVPTGGGGGRGGLLMPKLKHLWRVRFVNFGPIAGGAELTQQIKSITKPNITWNKNTIDTYNSKAHILGKPVWNDLTITFYDNITNDISNLVGNQLQKQFNFFEQTTPAAGINYKFTVFIEQMDGGNDTVLDQWICEGCMITGGGPDAVAYEDDGIALVSITVSVDNCTHSDGLFPEFTLGIPGVRA